MSIAKIQEIIAGMQDAKPSLYWMTCKNVDILLPDLICSHLTIQRNGKSVWTHTMEVIDLLDGYGPIALLSGLFHDLGKCCVPTVDDPSSPRFPEHDKESALIARTNLFYWGASSDIIDRVCRIVATHMYDIGPVPSSRTVRKFVADVGVENLEDWFLLRVADSSSYDLPQEYRDRLIIPFRKAIMSFVSRQPGNDQPTTYNSGEAGNMQIEGGES